MRKLSIAKQVELDVSMLSELIAHSQIIVSLPAPTAQRLPADFGEVDIAILEWIAAEGRRLARHYRVTSS
jgi:hypothetical protein